MRLLGGGGGGGGEAPAGMADGPPPPPFYSPEIPAVELAYLLSSFLHIVSSSIYIYTTVHLVPAVVFVVESIILPSPLFFHTTTTVHNDNKKKKGCEFTQQRNMSTGVGRYIARRGKKKRRRRRRMGDEILQEGVTQNLSLSLSLFLSIVRAVHTRRTRST